MSTADRLLARFGSNISQSLGVRATPAMSPEGRGETLALARTDDPMAGRTRARALGIMDIGNIIPDPDQPRNVFSDESLGRLSESLKKFGQLMPIRVRWNQSLSKWVIISGERRNRA